MRKIYAFCTLLLAFGLVQSQIIYVTPNGAGLMNGTSWNNALDGNSSSGNGYTKFADSMRLATSGKQFWVAEGTYYAATDSNRNRYFLIKDGVGYYGGFDGTESFVDTRAIMQHQTILTGDIGIIGDMSDNAYHIFGTDLTGTSYNIIPIIDGFDLCKANANSISGSSFNNSGPAIYIWYGKDIIVRNCIISNNNCLRGGAIFSENNGIVQNCLLVNNSQSAVAGGISSVSNSTIVNNNTGISIGDNAYIDNSIIWNNSSQGNLNSFFRSCLTQTGTLNANQIFVNPSAGIGINYDGLSADWNLTLGSPCIDAGENSLIPYNTYTDCKNMKRISNSRVDIGALEYSSVFYQTNISHISCSNPTISMLTDSTLRVTWIRGNGNKCRVWIAKTNQSINIPKTNGRDYNASSIYRAGDYVMENGIVWFCVYNDINNVVDISGLSPGTNYKVCIFEHFTDSLAQLPVSISFSTTGSTLNSSQLFYVKNGGGINGHDGRTWETAFSSPLAAISLSKASDKIWIAGGTYIPSYINNRYDYFLLKEGVNIFGGFAGNETSISQRIPNTNETILSGNIGNLTDSLDNSFHVIYSLPASTLWSDTVILDNITIQGGMANGSGDNICGGGILLNSNCVLKMESCKLVSNSCLGVGGNYSVIKGGGGLMNKGYLIMEDCEIFRNTAIKVGGGIFNSNLITLKNCKVFDNKIVFLSSGSWYQEWGGGGLYNYLPGNFIIDSCEIKNNSTQSNLHGGGIYNKGGKLQIRKSIISNNFSARDGGGVYTLGVTKIINSHFTLNQSAYVGGGVYASDSLIIDSCLFDYNAGHNSPSIYSGSYAVITNSEISHSNSTGQSGIAGGINSNGKSRIINCFIHSHSTKGFQYNITGGMFNIAYVFTGSDGGAIFHTGDSLYVDNCILFNNLAGGGGGIAVHSGIATIKNTIIANNTAADGGALINYGNIKLYNCLVTNNSGFRGGIICNVDNGKYQINNSTIANNILLALDNNNAILKHGMSGKLTSNNIKISNSIIKSTFPITGCYPGATGTDSISYSCITGGFAGIGNINADPLFVNPAIGNDTSFSALIADWRLRVNSPCINAGNDTLVTDSIDIDGNVRRFNKVDMGAYEFYPYIKTLNLKLFLEGLYNGTNMDAVSNGLEAKWNQDTSDRIIIELHSSQAPFNKIYYDTNYISKNGNSIISLPTLKVENNYIVVRHRNHLETWSADPVSFANDTVSYNFTIAASQAFADNQKEVATGIFAIMVGDINQDGVVDLSDLVYMDNDLTNGTVAYVVTDLNGDGVVDLSDLVIIDGNITNGAVVVTP